MSLARLLCWLFNCRFAECETKCAQHVTSSFSTADHQQQLEGSFYPLGNCGRMLSSVPMESIRQPVLLKRSSQSFGWAKLFHPNPNPNTPKFTRVKMRDIKLYKACQKTKNPKAVI